MAYKNKTIGMISVVKLICLFCLISPIYGQNDSIAQNVDIEVTYIANEGVLISSGDQQLLIDGLFRGGVYGYQTIPSNLLEKLETAKPPYDQINLVLITHLHLDHFHSESVGRHLEYNQNAVMVAGQDVVDILSADYYNFARIENRIKSVTPKWKERISVTENNFKIDVLKMRHGGSMNYGLDHVAYIVQFGGVKILHIGDVEISEEDFTPFNLKDAQIDIAFIPDWFLTYAEGREIIKDHIAPREIIAIHIKPTSVEKRKEIIAKHFPQAVVFDKPLEKRTFRIERK